MKDHKKSKNKGGVRPRWSFLLASGLSILALAIIVLIGYYLKALTL